MNTLEKLQNLFAHDLSELEQLQKSWWTLLSASRVVKEEHLGRCCYLAEELLGPDDLRTLKGNIGIDERRWRSYKARISG
ncbi:MAG TPA: hypothetical protein VL485_13885 [Ktedonobacteraceae bacterium]|jgi:hypothetical protein|nr:hypothetical protein [Ktedonobacteraceae bacterium]